MLSVLLDLCENNDSKSVFRYKNESAVLFFIQYLGYGKYTLVYDYY
jgi:hypothetical protein